MHRSGRFLATLAAAAIAACGADHEPSPAPPPVPAGPGPAAFRVMTQNLYLGADLDLLLAPDVNVPATVDRLWASVQATDFPSRAKALADAIQAADADVIALQEASLWRTQTPGDHLPVPDATTVAYDFVDLLVKELAARNLEYRVVATSTNADVELPGTTGTDYRLTDRDAILAKASLPAVAAGSGTFSHLAALTLPNPAPGQPPLSSPIPRGWIAVDLRAGGRTVHLVNTHLEAFSSEVATQQVGDLLAAAGTGSGPTIVVGDMNLPPGSGGYDRFVAPGTRLADAWTVVHGADPGLTCCWAPDLRGGSLATRIDLVFATPELRPTAVDRLEEGVRTPAGLSPSDHLGVVAAFDASAATSTVAPAAILVAPR